MVRFFVSPEYISATSVALSAEDTEHIRALRLNPDESFIVCDGNGLDYVCRLGQRDSGSTAEIVSHHPSRGEPSVRCRVFMAFSKGDRLDYAVQKSVELGAHEIILFESERCVAIPSNIPKKIIRLQRIALEAAKQSNRGIIPLVTSGGIFVNTINEAALSSMLSLLLYENEEQLHIKSVLEQHFPPLRESEVHDIKSVSIFSGPEGGFEPHEIEFAQSKGIQIVSLGQRTLRTETAPVVALATIMYQSGNL